MPANLERSMVDTRLLRHAEPQRQGRLPEAILGWYDANPGQP